MIPEPPDDRVDRKVPESIDELATEMELHFQEIEAEVKELHEELREAGEKSETLRKRLLA